METYQVVPDAPESRFDPTPSWQTTMTQILWGLALSTLTLEIPLLQELLSFLGLLLLYLGFRAIRRENKWLFRCYVFTAVRCIALVPIFALNATIFQNQFYTSALGYLTNLASMFLCWSLYSPCGGDCFSCERPPEWRHPPEPPVDWWCGM